MGNGRNSLPTGMGVGDGSPDISRNDPPLDNSPAPPTTAAPGLQAGGQHEGDLEEGEEDEDEEGSAPSESASTPSTLSTQSPADVPNCKPAGPQPRPAGAGGGGGGGGGAIPPPLPYHSRNHPNAAPNNTTTTTILNASNRLDCEEGDSDMDAAAGECERLLGPQPASAPSPKLPHSQHATTTTTTQSQPPPSSHPPQPTPTQSTPHRSSLTEYASSPPQSRYAGDSSRGQCPANELLASSDGDTSGTPLLSDSPQHDLGVGQLTPNGSSSHLHDASSSDGRCSSY